MSMLPNIETMAGRLLWAREKSGLSQTALAKKLGVSQGAIEKAENGHVRKPKYLPEAAEIFGVSYDWLARNVQPYTQETRHSGGLSDTAPVYGYASGAGSSMMINDGSIIDRQPRNNPNMGRDGFYMIVVGDSMEPRYEQGEKIAVSKSLPPRKGKDCVIEFLDGSAAIKRFISMTDKELICEQINPKKQIKYNMKEVLAVHAVVGHEF